MENLTKQAHSFCETPKEKCTMNYCDENGCQNRERELVEPKQETLEEVAKKFLIKELELSNFQISTLYSGYVNAVVKFHKEQQERSYSEEEVKFIERLIGFYWVENNSEHPDNLEEWELSQKILEQFKKN